jgi:hypothetical protein
MYEPLDEADVQVAKGPPAYVKRMQSIWLFLLMPWMLFAMGSGMAFDGGPTSSAYLFVWSVWTYPLVLIAAMILKKWIPQVMFLPFANIVMFMLSAGTPSS